MSEVSPDELDVLLGCRAREREEAELDARAPEWEAVAHGGLGVEDAITQRREAGDEDVERAADYFRPMDTDETTSLVDGLLAGLAGEDATGDESGNPVRESGAFTKPDNLILLPTTEGEASKPGPAKPGEIAAHDPGSSRSWWIPGGMLAAAAAAIAVWWIWPPSEEIRGIGRDETTVAQRDPLPSYVLETDGGLKQLRGDTDGSINDDAPHRYRRQTKFEWILRPKSPVSGEIAVRAFAFVSGGQAALPLATDALVEIADSGAIRIAGQIAQLGLEPGRYTIALVIGRPDALPEQAPDSSGPRPNESWELRRVEITIED